MTENATHTGQAAQSALAIRERTSPNITIPTIRASIECRLGIAAYGFDANEMRPLLWLIDENWPSVSTKPHSGNIRGGAVGITTYPTSPIRLATMSQFRNAVKR